VAHAWGDKYYENVNAQAEELQKIKPIVFDYDWT